MTWLTIKDTVITQLKHLYATENLLSPQLRKLGLIYSSYRLIVSLFLMLTSYAALKSTQQQILPTLLQQMALSFYMIFSPILLGLFYFVPKKPQRQLALGLAVDVIILSLLLYTNGVPDLQLTMLYMVVVAASFMLLQPPQALVVTLLAIIFIIYQQFFLAIANSMSLANLGDALLMSASFLVVGYLSWSISQRLVHVEKMALAQAQEVSRLNAINQEVISKMVSGVLVIDNNKLVLANQAACNLLHINIHGNNDESLRLLEHQLFLLHPDLCDWFLNLQTLTHGQAETLPNEPNELKKADLKKNDNTPHSLIKSHDDGLKKTSIRTADTQTQHPKLASQHKAGHNYPHTFIYELPNFASTSLIDKLRVELTPLKNNSQLLILEDLRREQAGAQQLKLASLGQLTASIAHEIRNPLAAISQASQLLIEEVDENQQSNIEQNSPVDANAELYQMIFAQTKRVNRIIEDVLKLSRQQKSEQKKLDLPQWLTQFINNHFKSHDVFLHVHTHNSIYFDPNQLEQILINLINNGLRFSSKASPHAFVDIEVYQVDNDTIIDVIDDGDGVKHEDVARIFEPFFTTDIDGTGLGLYLSQAFTEANHARLLYVSEHERTCFRLIIPLYQPAHAHY